MQNLLQSYKENDVNLYQTNLAKKMLKNLIWKGLGLNCAKFGMGLGRSTPFFRYFFRILAIF